MVDNLRGSAFMVLAMAFFSLEDAFIKAAAATVPLGEILLLLGFFGMLIFMLLTKRAKENIFHPAMLSWPILIRAVCEALGRLFFSVSLVLLPLSTISAILQATPLVVVMGAAIFFGEKVGWRRWSAILFGFVGVLLIIRPGMEGFEFVSLFAVLGMLGFAGRDLSTRAAPKILSNVQLGVYGFFVLMPVGLVLLMFDETSGGVVLPSGVASLQILGIIVFGVAAYYFLTIAMRIGEVSVTITFRYTRMVFALAIGVIVFGERPDLLTIIGITIIIGGGVYTLLRSRALAKG